MFIIVFSPEFRLPLNTILRRCSEYGHSRQMQHTGTVFDAELDQFVFMQEGQICWRVIHTLPIRYFYHITKTHSVYLQNYINRYYRASFVRWRYTNSNKYSIKYIMLERHSHVYLHCRKPDRQNKAHNFHDQPQSFNVCRYQSALTDYSSTNRPRRRHVHASI